MSRWIIPLFLASTIPGWSCKAPPPSPVFNLTDQPDIPQIVGPDLVSTHLYERDIAISPDGTEIIYTSCDYRQTVRCLVRLRWSGKSWEGPEVLPISGQWHDMEPFITYNGRKLFFASNRPLPNETEPGDYNLWYASREADEWSSPRPLPEVVNTSGQEFFPSVASNGNLYFTATREAGPGREDIYVSRWEVGTFQPPIPLDSSINTEAFEFNAWISPAEDLLIFSSFGRSDGLGGGDLYLSRTDSTGAWQQAIHLPEGINSDKLEYCPFLDQQRGNLYFTSDRTTPHTKRLRTIGDLEAVAHQLQNGMGNIYRISAESLP